MKPVLHGWDAVMEIDPRVLGLEVATDEVATRARAVAAELLAVASAVRECGELAWEAQAAARYEEEVAERVTTLLRLEAEVDRLRRQVQELEAMAYPGRRIFAAGPQGDVVAVPRGSRPARVTGAGALGVWRPLGGGR